MVCPVPTHLENEDKQIPKSYLVGSTMAVGVQVVVDSHLGPFSRIEERESGEPGQQLPHDNPLGTKVCFLGKA